MTPRAPGLALVLTLSAALYGGPADAQTNTPEARKTETPAAPSAAPSTSAAPTPEASPKTAHVEGFRSAHFGMAEPDVRAAIAKDFPAAAGAIRESFNPVERTRVLSIKSGDVLPEGGTAEVSYIFGYKSKTLIQVAVVWSKKSDDSLAPATLLADGEGLRAYFLAEGFPPSQVAANVELPDGILLFRGRDADGREVLLMLRGAPTPDSNGKGKTFTPLATALIYVAKPGAPDTYKIPAGKF